MREILESCVCVFCSTACFGSNLNSFKQKVTLFLVVLNKETLTNLMFLLF